MTHTWITPPNQQSIGVVYNGTEFMQDIIVVEPASLTVTDTIKTALTVTGDNMSAIEIGSTNEVIKTVSDDGVPVTDATGTWSLQDLMGAEITNGLYANNLDGTYTATLTDTLTSSLTQFKSYKIISVFTDSVGNVDTSSCQYRALVRC